MSHLFEQFIKERRYLHNLSEGTLTYYKECHHIFNKLGALDPICKGSLNNALITLRERGVKTGAINSYIRGINVYLKWLAENGHYELFSLKPLKAEQTVLRTFTERDLKAIVSYKPKNRTERRLCTLLLVLIDTGIRINEAFTLKKEKVDFENLLLTVNGKGNKERVVPFSYELRKALFKFATSHKFDLIFCNRDGGKLRYDNLRRDFNNLMKKLDIENVDGAFHAFRRAFATNYIRSNGNPFVLQRLLGHTTLTMTNRYVKLVTEDLQIEQHRTSLLNRLK